MPNRFKRKLLEFFILTLYECHSSLTKSKNEIAFEAAIKPRNSTTNVFMVGFLIWKIEKTEL